MQAEGMAVVGGLEEFGVDLDDMFLVWGSSFMKRQPWPWAGIWREIKASVPKNRKIRMF